MSRWGKVQGPVAYRDPAERPSLCEWDHQAQGATAHLSYHRGCWLVVTQENRLGVSQHAEWLRRGPPFDELYAAGAGACLKLELWHGRLISHMAIRQYNINRHQHDTRNQVQQRQEARAQSWKPPRFAVLPANKEVEVADSLVTVGSGPYDFTYSSGGAGRWVLGSCGFPWLEANFI